jgi:transposase
MRMESLVLYDLTSSYFEGKTCPLAKLGHNRDGKKGKLQVNYGLLADGRGCPVSVSVFEGNTADPKALTSEAQRLKERFGLISLVVVGDRGMVGQKQIEEVLKPGGLDWITALKTGAIRALVVDGSIQLGLFDERNLFSFEHPDYPGERLVACRNPELGKLRAHKRESLIEATKTELEKVRGMVGKGKLKNAAAIGVRVGKVVNKYKVAKHFVLDIRDDGFGFQVNEESVLAEAALDGIYVVRTSLSEARMCADDAVRNYKALSQVERAFRSLKTIDLHVRPIHHRLEDRVRAHIFLCMLAYYVTWHMIEALRPVLFADEYQEAKKTRDPVAPARRSREAIAKVKSRKLENGDDVHSLRTLLKNLSGIVKNVCRRKGAKDNVTTTIVTTPTPAQTRVFQFLDAIRP